MTTPVGPAVPGPGVPADARLRQATARLEGVFIEQLLKAMRETVPQDGVISPAAGEDMFSSLLDRHLAELAASRSERGLGAALYERLRRHLPAADRAEQDAASAAAGGGRVATP